jgi:HSP20 family protein
VFESGWTDDYLNLRFVVPGVSEGHVEITMQGNQLVISGERPTPENFSKNGGSFYRLPYGKFERKVDLPNGLDTDHIEAHLHHGLLDIRIPIAETMKPKRIEIQSKVEGAKKTAEIAA